MARTLQQLASWALATWLTVNSLPASAHEHTVWIDAWNRTPLSTTVTRGTTAVQGTVPIQFSNQTYRLMAFTTLGGKQVRVKFSNAFTSTPLIIGVAHIALRESGASIQPRSDRTLRFHGHASLTLDPGAEIWSDPVTLSVAQHSDIAVSMYLPQTFTPTTFHPTGSKTSYLSNTGNFVAATTMPTAVNELNTTTMVFFVSEIQVLTDNTTKTIVALGDSITDGACSNVDADGGWPELLSKRLATSSSVKHIAVLNAGIGSNRFAMSDGAGIRGLLRLPELLKRPKVAWVILLEGVNDISYEHPTPDNLITAYKDAIARAHAAGIKIIGVPILPFKHSPKDVDDNETTRSVVNAWIRTSGAFDQVIDFEPVLADPDEPSSIKAELTCDHVHPNQAGYQAMADAIDLTLFQ